MHSECELQNFACPIQTSRKVHDSSRLGLIWMGLLTYTHVCVDSSRTVLEHHRHVNVSYEHPTSCPGWRVGRGRGMVPETTKVRLCLVSHNFDTLNVCKSPSPVKPKVGYTIHLCVHFSETTCMARICNIHTVHDIVTCSCQVSSCSGAM